MLLLSHILQCKQYRCQIMLRLKITFSKRRSSCYRYVLSAFAGIYYRFWLTGSEFIHKSLLEKIHRVIFFTNDECHFVYFIYFYKPIVVLFVFEIFSFKCVASKQNIYVVVRLSL